MSYNTQPILNQSGNQETERMDTSNNDFEPQQEGHQNI
jgi:hypothetical protein